jgi:MoaA/NifB/PqqE/SkfB family radical SAM enzyme
VGWGYLKFENFKKFVDTNPTVESIELSNWGEIFLNPELKQILEYAYSKGIRMTADNGVNMNTAGEDVLECLVRYRFESLEVSLDGATNDTYSVYRRGGNFDRVIANIRKVNYYKKRYNSIFPRMTWKFIVFGHNENEIPKAKKMAEELDMAFLGPCLPWDQSVSPIRNKDLVMKEAGTKAISEIESFKVEAPCRQLWLSPQINWDGKLLGCCANKWGDFGNVFSDGLKRCLLSERYIYAKKVLMGKARIIPDIACSMCHHYQKDIKLSPLTSLQIILG